MNNDVGKILLMIGILLIASGLATNVKYIVKEDNGDSNGYPGEYIYVDSSRWRMKDDANDTVLKLAVSNLPIGPTTMKVYGIKYPEFTKDNTIQFVKSHSFEIEQSPQKQQDYEYWFYNDTASIFVLSNMYIKYTNVGVNNLGSDVILEWPSPGKDAVFSDKYINIDQAEKIALAFTKKHGGIPEDGILDDKQTATMSILANSSTFVWNDSYDFYFHRYIDERSVVGGMEKILIIVDNIGNVRYYSRCWLTEYQDVKETVNIHSSYDALNSLTTIPFATSDEELMITSVDLAYYNPMSDHQTSTIRPIWVFYLNNEKLSLKVDAETLEQYFG